MCLVLSSCAAQTSMTASHQPCTDSPIVQPCPTMNAADGWKACPYVPFCPRMNLGKAVTDLATIPLRLPDAMISNYPSGGRVYCRSWTYKDQLRTTCY
jgi:hypothetical protein